MVRRAHSSCDPNSIRTQSVQFNSNYLRHPWANTVPGSVLISTIRYCTVIYKFSVPGTSNDIVNITGKLDTVS
jgi:hypothetical protein